MGSNRAPRAMQDEALQCVNEVVKVLARDKEQGLAIDCINDWEWDFLHDVRNRNTLTVKQVDKVFDIYAKFKADHKEYAGDTDTE